MIEAVSARPTVAAQKICAIHYANYILQILKRETLLITQYARTKYCYTCDYTYHNARHSRITIQGPLKESAAWGSLFEGPHRTIPLTVACAARGGQSTAAFHWL